MADTPAGQGGKSSNALVIVLMVIIMFMVAAIIALLVMRPEKTPEVKQVVVKKEPSVGIMKSLGEQVLNLADAGDPPRYIKVSVSIELKKEEKEQKAEGG